MGGLIPTASAVTHSYKRKSNANIHNIPRRKDREYFWAVQFQFFLQKKKSLQEFISKTNLAAAQNNLVDNNFPVLLLPAALVWTYIYKRKKNPMNINFVFSKVPYCILNIILFKITFLVRVVTSEHCKWVLRYCPLKHYQKSCGHLQGLTIPPMRRQRTSQVFLMYNTLFFYCSLQLPG